MYFLLIYENLNFNGHTIFLWSDLVFLGGGSQMPSGALGLLLILCSRIIFGMRERPAKI